MSEVASESPSVQHWSRSAIASPILGILGFATLWLVIGLFLSAAGAVCGHIARHRTRGGEWRGRRLATFGIAASYASMLFFPVLVLIISASFPAFNLWRSERGEWQRQASQEQASRLFLACEAYARSNRNRYPSSWDQLSGKFMSGIELRRNLRSPHPGGKAVAFEIVPHDRPVLTAIADSVIVIQEIAPPDVPGIAVVYADGTVQSIHNPAHEIP